MLSFNPGAGGPSSGMMKLQTGGAWFARLALFAMTGLIAGAPATASTAVADQPGAFAFQWTGDPADPQPWTPDNWDLIVHARDQRTWEQLDPVPAQHGADCSPPPATHTVTSFPDAVFICRNHMMTGFLPGGYGEIEFVPDHLADWSDGTTVISWHQSTFRTSARDWTDILVTPFDENLVLPDNTDVDLSGRPRDALSIEMSESLPTTFSGTLMNDFRPMGITTRDTPMETVLSPSANTRTHFQLEISSTHVRFGIPETGTWWVDREVPTLKFTRGIVQFGHHSYTPGKECSPTPGVLSCTGDTWHWSDVAISRATPFTMLRSTASQPGQHVSRETSQMVQFASAVPSDSHLRFAAVGKISVSFDGGRTWTGTKPQPSEGNPKGQYSDASFTSYWVPMPEGATAALFRGEDVPWAPWRVIDPAVWSLAGGAAAPSVSQPAAEDLPPSSVNAQASAPAHVPPVARLQSSAARAPVAVRLQSWVGMHHRLTAGILLGLGVVTIGLSTLFWVLRRRPGAPTP